MQSDGEEASYNPMATLASLVGKREKLQEELQNIENQVFELETSHLQESSNFGNAMKGFDGFLSASKNTTMGKPKKGRPGPKDGKKTRPSSDLDPDDGDDPDLSLG